MSNAALIVAAGRGTRAGGEVPKQWRKIAGQSVITHTLQAFSRHPTISSVILVLHPDDLHLAPNIDGLTVTTGGVERSDSVKMGSSNSIWNKKRSDTRRCTAMRDGPNHHQHYCCA